jgi:hypothetical protein
MAVFWILAASPARAEPVPIPEGPDAASLPRFSGAPFAPRPLFSPDPPRHPHMAPNGAGTLHVDGYQTDVHQAPGPLGNATARSNTFHGGDCASVTFDSKGRIVTVCVSLTTVTLTMIDPRTLDTLATMRLPERAPSANPFQNFTGGGYFYLDDRDRAVIPTTSRHVLVVRETDEPGFAVDRDFDLSSAVPDGDAIISALPDWTGRIWFASRAGVVGTIDAATGGVKSVATREPIGNSFAVDSDGSVFIVTDRALHRYVANADGLPISHWAVDYANDGKVKPGQTQAGSGTTPTLIGRDRVAITDNADPVAVLVHDRRSGRLLCRQPVFEKGASSTDQSLIGTPDFLIAENNYGYTGPASTQDGKTTVPGLARVDLHPSGRGCRLAWVSQETAPTVVPKLSTATGLVYTYTKPASQEGKDAWYLTAIDARTGRTAFKALAGEGLGHNNNYAPVTLGPDGTAYVGVLGGLVALRDATPPAARAPGPPARPRLRLSCARTRVRVKVSGPELLRAVVRSGRRRVTDGRAPFSVRLRTRAGRSVRVRARQAGGRWTGLRGTAPRCGRR